MLEVVRRFALEGGVVIEGRLIIIEDGFMLESGLTFHNKTTLQG